MNKDGQAIVTLILFAIIGPPSIALGVAVLIISGDMLGWLRWMTIAGLVLMYFGGLGAATRLLGRGR